MKNLLEKAYNVEDFRQQGHQLIDMLADYLANAQNNQDLPVLPYIAPDDNYEKWKTPFTKEGTGKNSIPFFAELIKSSMHTHSPRYVGHQVAVPAPLTALTELLAGFMNAGNGVYEMGTTGVAIERVVVKNIAKIIGMTEDADGFLTSGGSLGNLTALLAARRSKTSFDIWEEGHGEEELAVMVSEEAHYCVSRAIKIMGLGEKGMIKVPVNQHFQMDAHQLESIYQDATQRGKKIIAVVGNASSTATGAYDPLDKIADFCEKYKLWFHVDGAHGGAVVFSEKYKPLAKGIEKADSVVIDFHKMMMIPATITGLFFKNGDVSYHTFAQNASYLWEQKDAKEWHNLGKRTFECTKHTMSLGIYALMQSYGTQLFSDYIDTLYDLSKSFALIIQKDKNFELLTQPQGNILCFRFVPQDIEEKELNQLNSNLRKEIISEGSFYLVQTQMNGKIYLRTTLMNPFTTEMDLKALLERIKTVYQKMYSSSERVKFL